MSATMVKISKIISDKIVILFVSISSNISFRTQKSVFETDFEFPHHIL